jgi:hypothetical protein
MTNPNDYPDLDPDVSAYTVLVRYDGCDPLRFPGGHDSFRAASTRARKIRDGLLSAGETGISVSVGFHGARPAGFPRNGVPL